MFSVDDIPSPTTLLPHTSSSNASTYYYGLRASGGQQQGGEPPLQQRSSMAEPLSITTSLFSMPRRALLPTTSYNTTETGMTPTTTQQQQQQQRKQQNRSSSNNNKKDVMRKMKQYVVGGGERRSDISSMSSAARGGGSGVVGGDRSVYPGRQPPRTEPLIESKLQLVIYNLNPKGVVGMYHTGVILFGEEWAFGGDSNIVNMPDGPVKRKLAAATGIFSVMPMTCMPHGSIDRVVDIGYIAMTQSEFDRLYSKLTDKWRVEHYHLLKRNCNHFSDWLLKHVMTHYAIMPPTGVAIGATAGGRSKPKLEDDDDSASLDDDEEGSSGSVTPTSDVATSTGAGVAVKQKPSRGGGAFKSIQRFFGCGVSSCRGDGDGGGCRGDGDGGCRGYGEDPHRTARERELAPYLPPAADPRRPDLVSLLNSTKQSKHISKKSSNTHLNHHYSSSDIKKYLKGFCSPSYVNRAARLFVSVMPSAAMEQIMKQICPPHTESSPSAAQSPTDQLWPPSSNESIVYGGRKQKQKSSAEHECGSSAILFYNEDVDAILCRLASLTPPPSSSSSSAASAATAAALIGSNGGRKSRSTSTSRPSPRFSTSRRRMSSAATAGTNLAAAGIGGGVGGGGGGRIVILPVTVQ